MRPFLLILPVLALACRCSDSRVPAQAADTACTAMQSRGQEAMEKA
jgi:hypothetical protein